MRSETFLVVEIGTGLVDGWYQGYRGNAEGMAAYWDERRPRFKHALLEVVEGGTGRLPGSQLMNKHCSGGVCKCREGLPVTPCC